jgi:hypothetical protein
LPAVVPFRQGSRTSPRRSRTRAGRGAPLRARADPVRLFGAAGAIDGALLRPFGSGPPIQFHGEHFHVPPFRRGAAARVQRLFVVARPDRAFK